MARKYRTELALSQWAVSNPTVLSKKFWVQVSGWSDSGREKLTSH